MNAQIRYRASHGDGRRDIYTDHVDLYRPIINAAVLLCVRPEIIAARHSSSMVMRWITAIWFPPLTGNDLCAGVTLIHLHGHIVSVAGVISLRKYGYFVG